MPRRISGPACSRVEKTVVSVLRQQRATGGLLVTLSEVRAQIDEMNAEQRAELSPAWLAQLDAQALHVPGILKSRETVTAVVASLRGLS